MVWGSACTYCICTCGHWMLQSCYATKNKKWTVNWKERGKGGEKVEKRKEFLLQICGMHTYVLICMHMLVHGGALIKICVLFPFIDYTFYPYKCSF